MTTALEETCKARVGSVLQGKWKLERLLGIGGMAAVYAGHHKIGRHDAIKILHPEIARQADLKKRFEIEAMATNRFHHAGAVEIRDYDVTPDGCPFMVMEMLDGESLGERARRLGEIKEPDVLRYTDELLDVLAAAHKEGIVHRDIKLDNLFITSDDHVKVLDFGIARIVSNVPFTKVGVRLGTTAYMPPEQLKGQDIDGRADLFAVGATMFRLLAKRRIHEAGSDAEMVVKMARDPAPKIRDVAPLVSPNAGLIVDRALAYDVNQRYPSAQTMQEDVRSVRQGKAPAYAVSRASGLPAIGGNTFEPTGVANAADARAAEMTRRETPNPFAAAPTGATEMTRREVASPHAASLPVAPQAVGPTVPGTPMYAAAATAYAPPAPLPQGPPESVTVPRAPAQAPAQTLVQQPLAQQPMAQPPPAQLALQQPGAPPKKDGAVVMLALGAVALIALGSIGSYFLFFRTSTADANAKSDTSTSDTSSATASATTAPTATTPPPSSIPAPTVAETGHRITPASPQPTQPPQPAQTASQAAVPIRPPVAPIPQPSAPTPAKQPPGKPPKR